MQMSLELLLQVYILNGHIQQAGGGRVLSTEFIFTAGIVFFFFLYIFF